MMSINRSREEIFEALYESMHFMAKSASEYDLGRKEEGKRVAVELRKLLHDTNRSCSILSQLNLKQNQFFDSVEVQLSDDFLNWTGLSSTSIAVGKEGVPVGVEEKPVLGYLIDVAQKKKFGDWWESVIIRDFQKNCFTRKDIVLKIANQDNGAHVDPRMDENYYSLTRENSMGIRVGVKNSETSEWQWTGSNAIHFAAVRQIAHEVFFSLYQITELQGDKFLEFYVNMYKPKNS